MGHPHDGLFKFVFQQPEHAASELRAIFPSALSARLDWCSLQLEPASFVDEELRARHADLLFSVRCDGAPAYVYVLFEHQSSCEPRMAFRMLRYVVRVWDAVSADDTRSWDGNGPPGHTNSDRLPAIIPVVLYHGKGPWAAPTELRALIDLDPVTMAQVEPFQPQFRFLLDDLSLADDHTLRNRALTPMAAAALGVLARARSRDALSEVLQRWADMLLEVGRGPDGVRALRAFWEYALLVGNMDPDELRDLAQSIGPAGEEAYMTAAEVLKAEGRAEGKAEVVLRLLRLRFGEVPEVVRQRIANASSDELDLVADRLVTASTLEECAPDQRT